MNVFGGIALFVLTVSLMEGFAYVAHRWVMHGWAGRCTSRTTSRATTFSKRTTCSR